VEYEKDGEVTAYGFGQKAGSLDAPDKGKMVRVFHFKHYQIALKREGRGGDAVTGRGMGAIPTAYDVHLMTANADDLKALGVTEEEARQHSTAFLTEQVQKMKNLAADIGSGADSWDVKELYRAIEKGVASKSVGVWISEGYDHKHTKPIENFRLHSHLNYAHGVTMDPSTPSRELAELHGQLHAKMSQRATVADREQDPGEDVPNRTVREWPAAQPIEADLEEVVRLGDE
jgi:hypothetical protein